MAKRSRDDSLEEGERLLGEWGVARCAGVPELAALLNRAPAADLAIARRLGALVGEESAQLLQRLEGSTADRHVRKEARRALYRLQQRGVEVPEREEPELARVVFTPVEGYVSPVDGRGDQLVWLVKLRSGAAAQLFALINDPEGLREVALNLVTRKALRSLRAELADKHDLRLVEVDGGYADFLIHRAFAWARAREARVSGDYPALRAQIIKQPAATDLPPAVLASFDPEAIAAAEELLPQSAELLQEKEFRTWVVAPEQAQPYIDELADIKHSPLLLNRAQQEERFGSVVERAVEEIFGPERRESWQRRMYEIGYFLAATRRPERARQAVAVAQSLGRSRSAREIPFCDQLVRTSLRAFFQANLQEEAERQRSSLVVTPEQARAERQRRGPE